MDPTLLGNMWQFYQQMAQQQYQWGLDQFNKNSGLTDQVVDNFLTNAHTLQGAGEHDLSRYQNLFQPQENQLVADANSYAGPARMQANMGAAAAEASQAGEEQRQGAIADLQSYGIDPSSGRYAALDMASRSRQAASAAGAANTARQQTEATGRALRSEAIQVGQRYPGQVVNDLSTSLQGLTGAENARLANTNTGVNAMGSAPDWAKIGLQSGLQGKGLGGAGGAGGKGGGGGGVSKGGADPFNFGSGFNTQQEGGESSMDWNGSGPSAVNGGGTSPGGYSSFSGPIPTESSPDPYGSLDDNSGGSGWGGDYEYAAGGAIPQDMSPSGGQEVDDVPATIQQTGQPARLNVNEFVIPQDVALWKGQEFFQKLIDQSRQGLQGATAKPQMKPAPSQGAIPVQ